MMTGFELRTSGIRSDHSSNLTTATGLRIILLSYRFLMHNKNNKTRSLPPLWPEKIAKYL